MAISMVIQAQQTRILFLGNSYTYVNDLPGTLNQLALSLGDSIYYESNCPGGYMLLQHCTDPTSLAKLNTPGWDYVVIQAQSQEPALDSNAFYFQTYPYARKLDSLVHVVNPCAITLFYMTWGRKYGDSYWCPVNPPMCTFLGMNAKLRNRYIEMATDNYAQVAPAGVAWKNSWFADSTINLWSGDNSHPSVEGTYLTANVFYASIFKQTTIGSSFANGINSSQASFLRTIGSNTVLDSLDTWRLNQPPIHAAFTDTLDQSYLEVSSTSHNAAEFWWDFGDGVGYSSLENSTYYYSVTGTYQVKLTASNQCYSDTISTIVTINSIGVENQDDQNYISVYPNPVESGFFIDNNDLTGKSFQLMALNGKVIKTGIISSIYFDMEGIAPGIYIFQIENVFLKICKQ
jgi:PKD repeat protein